MFCPHCGNEVSDAEAYCHHCGNRLPALQAEETRSEEHQGATPWEKRGTQGVLGGLFATIWSVLFSPTRFFRSMPLRGGITDPLLYAIILSMSGFMLSYSWQVLMGGALPTMLPHQQWSEQYEVLRSVNIATLAILAPIASIAGIFVLAGLLHVLLLLVRSGKQGFEATFRVLSYGTSTFILEVIPIIGGVLWLFWTIVVLIIGLREAHGSSTGKVAFVVLFPLILCCGTFMFFLLLFMGTLAATVGGIHL